MTTKRIIFLVAYILGLVFAFSSEAAATLTVKPLTWNIIGLDSNNVNVGPNHFPVGARVCNSGGATTATVTFNWDDGLNKYTGNAYINLQGGSTDVVSLTFAGNGCQEAYFNVEVTRNASAYTHTRRYNITATDSSGTVTTPTPRELYVEHLISQSRNYVTDMQLSLDGTSYTSVAPGGSMVLLVGNTYWIKLLSSTATNGYEQIEDFIGLPNTVFQVLGTSTTYTADSSSNVSNPNNTLYGDGCIWENDPNSPNYRTCLSTGKAGGNLTTTYQAKVLSMPASPITNPSTLDMTIYDFSGSSYHYNSDYSASGRYVIIVDPTASTITKSFTPSTTSINGVSRLTITIGNTNPAVVSGYNFTDPLPANMKVATPPNASTASCGSPTFSPAANDTSLSFSNGTIAANGTCTIAVDVTATAAATYTNTTNHLYVDSLDTGKYASAVLTVTNTPPPPSPTCAVEMATWWMDSGSTGTSPTLAPNYTFKSGKVSSAVASASGNVSDAIDTTEGNPVNSWQGIGGWGGKGTVPPSGAYFQFAVDSSNFTNVNIAFDFAFAGNWSNSSDNHAYTYSSTDGINFTQVTDFTPVPTGGSTLNWNSQLPVNAAATGSGTTYFRIYAQGLQQSTAYMVVDNVYIRGCRVLDPPTITKSFSPNPVAVGGTSTLTFTITNPNTGPSATLSGISFDDYLPSESLQGTVAVTNGSPTVTGTGTAFMTQLAAGSIVSIPATPASLTGTVAVTSGSPTVTGTGTAFSTELAAGSVIVINTVNYTVADIISNTSLQLTNNYAGSTASGLTAGGYKNYTVSTIASDTSLTLSTNYAGPTASGLSIGSGLTLTAAPTTTCRGTVTGGSVGEAISLSGNRLQGTISVTNGSPTVTGTNTSFNTQLSVGSRISVNSVDYRVSAIGSATSLTLSTNYAGATASGLAYTYGDPLSGTVAVTNGSATVTGTGTAFTTQLVANDIVYINSVRYTVSTIASATSLTLTATYSRATSSGLAIFPDRMLRGTVAVTNGSPTVTGTSTLFTTELAAGSIIYISGVKYTVLSIASATSLTLTQNYAGTTATGLVVSMAGSAGLTGGATCTVTATVKASAAGVRANVSGFISSTQSGQNTTSTGYATANLTAVLPPQIAKQFAPNPILANGVSTLTFIITNPNQNNSVSGVAFSDTFPTSPGNMVVAGTPGASTSGCGTPTFAPVAGAGSITFSGGTIAGGGTCTVTVNVTAPVTGTYNNTSGNVSHIINSVTVNGNTASASLTVNPVHPGIAILKQVSSSATGPWSSFLATSTGANVYYKFTIENIGDVQLNPVSVSDPTLAASVNPSTCTWTNPLPVASPTQDPTETCVTGPVTAVSGTNQNTATAHGTYGGTVYNSNPSTATYATTGLTLVKSVTESSFSYAGDLLHYSYLVTNSGYAPLIGPVTVTDDKVSVTCPNVNTVGDLDNYLDPNESITCTATYTVTSGDVTAGYVTNIAYATAGGVTSNTDTKTVAVNPTLAVLSDFRAYDQDGHAIVQWETTSEIRTVGFYLLRLNQASGAYEQVNNQIVPALIGSKGGGLYRLADNGASSGSTYTYKLLEVENKGIKIEHGPYTVQITGTGAPLNSVFSREPHQIAAAKQTRIANAKKTRDAEKLIKEMRKGDLLKLSITDDGLYYLSASDIATITGMNPQKAVNMIKNSLFDLSSMGQEVAYRAAQDGSGIYFYGKGADSIYTSENIYWLSQKKGLPMAEVKGGTAVTTELNQAFYDTVHVEQDVMEAPELFNDPNSDYWFWDYILSGYDGMDTKVFTVPAGSVAESTSSATLAVHLQGITSTGANIDHDVVVSLNGAVIGEDRWQGATPHTLTATFSQALLQEGNNTVEVHGMLDTGVPYSMFFIDSFDLTYKRLYSAVNDSLRCRGDNNQVVSITGFANPAISVFDITDPNKPKYVSRLSIDGANGNYKVRFAPASAQTVYLAVSSTAVRSNFNKWASSPSSLSSKSNSADYLIITTTGLKNAAQPLASFRKGKGLGTMVVDLESIMDEFNYGVFNPNAIKGFLSYAYQSWSKAPRYVLLAGNGTYDYKDYYGYGDDLVPPLMVDTPYGLHPSDNALADVNGDSTPEMAMGRLPVVNADELQTVTNKIISYENATLAPWQKNLLMAADAADPQAGDFPMDSDSVAALVPSGYTMHKIYLSEHPLVQARHMLLDQIGSGALLLNYIGHGSVDRLANDGLLLSDDVSSMTNGSAMPIVIAMTCFMNDFAYPGYDTLGETLLLKDNGGAAAVWGPTGLSLSSEAVALDKKLFQAIFIDGQKLLGDAVLKALKGYGSGQCKPFMLDIYNIIGDPALRLR